MLGGGFVPRLVSTDIVFVFGFEAHGEALGTGPWVAATRE